MKGELVKRQDRYDLYISDGSKIASSAENPFGKLSKENCDAIFGIFDIDKFAEEKFTPSNKNVYGLDNWSNEMIFHAKVSFKEGFEKAIEIFKPIQQKTEIKVEIEMTEDWYASFKLAPKLDENDCLILKPIDNV